ncbi:hypothetical protein HBI56_218220 [Parastagonospora nodorum]|uniref:Uncharacterized protein n=2 Tax=Phaeosphaeria nodorum (strain SN15 / ATCC MYA-4574 / FGSC 10173) TaxID=321614 RepID=Q0UTU3_PHANO|nr:hypothetical protein SNOG_04821 [Parastagonospora nodorum SN15]KAH3904985.1 hypothetical protein HBH56_225830 [Parastagonospora nodorum]EAT87212.1 hypothetical protein SNOG_04821 [Parastagonospora nodorum SN15]KAH3935921.1 hypothetical protein HBH54_032890 [Parastagonospora nodorum]KAH3940023.1 hypothetical protein HBH53_223870 [Parastagonospora nodorum]KAH3957565.1 hypothetical protein HBH51_222830 [Parastagonospora nodorum]
MLFKSILPILAAAATAAALPQQSEVDQWTYPQFPENGASCPGWPGEEPTLWSFAQLKELAVEASKSPPYSDSAANHGGSCGFSVGIPMHIIGTDKGIGMISVAVDKTAKTIRLCGLQGKDNNNDGYNDSCEDL